MDSLIHADIFFFITTIAVILLTLGLIVALVYAIRILKSVDHISTKVKEESDRVIEDLGELRSNVKDNGWKLGHIMRFFRKVFKKK
ncbi:MAG: hypothetical protein ABI430_00225 [Candidatus Taylorbacteria bacterium]